MGRMVNHHSYGAHGESSQLWGSYGAAMGRMVNHHSYGAHGESSQLVRQLPLLAR